MTACEHLRPALGAYVLGALAPEEAEEVRRHLETCVACAAEHRTLAPLPGLLSAADGAEAVAAEPLPDAFEERLLDAYARERAGAAAPLAAPSWPRRVLGRLRPRRRAVRLGAAAAAVAVLAAAALVVVTGGGDEPAPAYEVALHGVGAAPGASARANLEALPEGTELHLWVRGLPTGAPAVYEVLCEAPGWSASAGTFRVNPDGRAYVVLTTAARRGEYDAIRVVRHIRTPEGELRTRDVLAARLS